MRNREMNMGKDYSTMIAEQYGSIRILPLSAGWEFMRCTTKNTMATETAALQRLAKQHQWQVTTELRRALNRPDQAVVVTNRSYTIQYVNSLFVRMTGYQQKDIVGRRPNFLQGVDTDPATRQRIRAALSEGQTTHETLLNYRQNGDAYWCDLTIFPVFNRQQELTNFIAFEQEMAQ